MELKYDSQLPTKMHIYALSTLFLIVVGFAVLLGPFVIAYFTNEKYDMEKLRQIDQEMKMKHQDIWQDLELHWKQFWINKIDTRLVKYYSFSDELGNNLERVGNQKLNWDADDFMDFYNRFLQGYPNRETLDIDGRVYYYLVDSLGAVRQSMGNLQPNWQKFSDLESLDVLLYWSYDISKMLKPDGTFFYLQCNVQLGINPDTLETVLTFLFYDFSMEEHNLFFAVSIEMGNILGRARDFFDSFESRLGYWDSNRHQLQTMLLVLDEAENGSFYFRTYGNNTGLEIHDLSRRHDALYGEIAEAILTANQFDSSLADPSINFLLSTNDKEQRGKYLDLDLQMRGHMRPFIVSNLYGSLDKNGYVPRITSVGKMYMLPPSRNLVILDSLVEQSWWDNGQFLNTSYHQNVHNIMLLFITFFAVMLIPLLLYAYFMAQYAKDFFQLSRYVVGLPTTTELLERHEGDIKPNFLAKITKTDKNTRSERLSWEVQQRLVKLVELVDYWREQSSTDELTGLLNRKGLHQVCSYEISRMKRSISSFSLVLLDIDFFKKVNDKFGHEVGDLALKSLAQSLISVFRTSDYLGRWGGEEFLIVLPDTLLQGAIQAAEQARCSVEKMMIQMRDSSLQLTISIGVASSSDKISFVDTLNFADKSLYRAKQSGRNQVWAFDDEDDEYFAVAIKR